ncbi:MAG: DNA topoisomerase (ATP-hydrolyzing) subunit B [bacterium]|nr:DNA topoisomerase (ATP-hydrolyzing) subunit B [bacterium]
MATEEKQKKSGYDASSITVLEGLDPVRKRPGMYIGSTASSGLHHLIWEVVDNSIDEAMGGYCTEINVKLLPKNNVSVTDNGRGIPVDIHKQFKVSALELVLTKLHAGGKFGGGGYKVSGGLHGVGVSVVNALSIMMRAEVKRDGKLWMQEYSCGKPKSKVKPVGTARGTGTTITFEPDASIFPVIAFDWQTVIDHLRQQAYLTKGITITVTDERTADARQSYVFYFEGGIKSYVRHLNHHKEKKHESIFYVDKEVNGRRIEIALQYAEDFKETVLAFANNIFNPEGGTHVVGFRTALTRTINNYARAKGFLKEKDENLTGEDTREGLTTVISVKLEEPQFEGQTKSKLGNDDIRTLVDTVLSEALVTFLEEHPRDGEAIIGKCLLASRARLAARAARDSVLRKGALEGLMLPGKLADCSSRDSKNTELFIVEGDSAGGCFSGDTKVALADGRNISFKELVREHAKGKKNYCYSIKNDGSIGIEKIESPRITKRNATVIKIVLDNNEEIVATPDHQFMLRDGTYKMAKDLTMSDSIMPLRRQLSRIGKRITIKGYEMVFDPGQHRWIFTHMLADAYNLSRGIYAELENAHRHHKDFNKLNNNPHNIVRLTKEKHLAHHAEMLEKTLHRPDVKAKVAALHKTPAFREKIRKAMTTPAMRKMLSERAKKQWENDAYKGFMKEKFLAFYAGSAEYRAKNTALLTKVQHEYWSKEKHRDEQAERVQQFFRDHPEQRTFLMRKAKEQWDNTTLRTWRSGKTKEQWTPTFRAQRLKTYNATYLQKALIVLKKILEKKGSIDVPTYNALRKETGDRSLIKFETICARFFGGDQQKLAEAVMHYNHKIKSITPLTEKIDVYDIEVPNTHNFALASGIFVHNSAKQGRNREFQAILPLRGKILNVERARIDKMLANNELRSLIIALGTNIGEQFNLAELRYERIVIMTDADVDGSHIRTLLLTVFWRYLQELIKTGHLYIAQPPLYRIQKGKDVRYVYTDDEKERVLKELSAKGGPATIPLKADLGGEKREAKSIKTKESVPLLGGEGEGEVSTTSTGIAIQRYKGLGEMNPDQLWETTMNPETRMMLQVTVDDAEKADEIFDILMGSEVAPRKHFITSRAKNVKNLDI